MKKIFEFLSASLLMLFLAVSPIKARECHSVYGGGEVCEYGEISLDKEVWNPEENEYWDNIDSNDYTFAPNQEVKFRIKIKNTDDEIKVSDSKIKDFLPDYLDFVSAEAGSDETDWDSDDREIKYYTGSLEEDETETVYLTVKVKSSGEIPEGVTCLKNKATGYSNQDDESDSDYASFCISRDGKSKVLGTTYPTTGSNANLILGLEGLGFLSLGTGYWYLLRKYRK